jgi:hypothetical protein
MNRKLVLSICFFINYISYSQNHIQLPLLDSIVSYDSVDLKPIFNDGADRFILRNIKYPSRAIEDEFRGKVIATFYIDIDGMVKDPKIIRDDGCNECAKEVLKVINTFPKWTPGFNNGKAVKSYYTLPVTFKLDNEENIDLDNKPAKFQGGDTYLNEFIDATSSSIKITTKLVTEKKGKFYADVEFNVLEDGSVSNSIIKSSNISDITVREKITNTINKMPKWYPEIKNGQPLVTTQKISLQF